MEWWIEWGYGVIEALQTLRTPLLDALFLALSFLGDEPFYLILVPVLYWAVDRRTALRFAVLFLVSTYLNSALKALWDEPRPSSARVEVLDDPGEGGLPSGHAQNSVVTWGLLAVVLRNPLAWAAAVLLMLGIGVSRVYLGVHFPHDVLLGWTIGIALLAAYLVLERSIGAWLGRRGTGAQIALAAGAAVVLLLLFRGGNALPGAATLAGVAVGAPLERAHLHFSARPTGVVRTGLRLAIGLAVALVIWAGLAPALAPLGEAGRILRYALLGLWVSFAGPWIFLRLRVAARER